MPVPEIYDSPMRDLRDVEALERVPLKDRIFSWNANDWVRRGCDRDPDKIALSYIADGDPDSAAVRLSYRDLKQRSTQIANLLHSYGLGPGDVVLFLLPTLPQLYTLTLGALARAIPCGINWMLKPLHVIELIRSTKAKVVVALGPTPGYEIWENLQSVRGEIPAGTRVLMVPGPGGATLPDSDLDALAARQPGDRLTFARDVKPDDLAVLVHSGGTTGSPKLVKLTHRGISYKCWANAWAMAHRPDDVIFSDYPMFHIAGMISRGIMAVAHGMHIVIPTPLGARDKRFIENYWRFVEKFRITILSGVPTTLATLVKNPPRGEDLSSLRPFATTGSTAFPAEIARNLEQITGVRMLLSYGSTEFTQNITQAPRDGDPKYGSAGIRLPYTQVRVVKLKPDGAIERNCAVDESGAVVAKGPSITPGYLDSRYDQGVLIKDGWINNGDLGRLDTDGFLWLTGRAKDVIIRGGHNIDPTVIEETLLKHPDVLLAAAVGRPDAYAGELPVAYVQLVADANATTEELDRFVRDNISERAAAPKDITILPRMPLTDVGKPAKPQLRRDAAQRTFAGVLAEVAGAQAQVGVVVQPDDAAGTKAMITLTAADANAKADVEQRIRKAMSAYASAYAIEWTA
ncbi:MAG: acyl-CoA synthetase [Rhizobiales bacterium]|nr:acyl-CoA synthetase [Hyphomicrobiales bacterium]